MGAIYLGEEVPRDNSIFLLAEGIISVLIVAFGVLIYFLSLRDAWLNGKKRDEGSVLNSVRKQYQMLLSDGFPYLMITPGFILLVFVVIFPILFGFAIAFTNYNLYHTPPAKLVDWVGLKNFVNIFTLSIWRSTFWMCCSGPWYGRCWRPLCSVRWACCWRFWSTKKICALNR